MILLALALAFVSGMVFAQALRRPLIVCSHHRPIRVWVVSGDENEGLPTQVEVDVSGSTIRRLLEPGHGHEFLFNTQGADGDKTAAQLAGWNADPVWRREP